MLFYIWANWAYTKSSSLTNSNSKHKDSAISFSFYSLQKVQKNKIKMETFSLGLHGSFKFKRFNVPSHQTHPKNGDLARKIIRYRKQEGFVDCASLVEDLGRKKKPHLAHQLVNKVKSEGLLPDNSTLCALMLCYANNGFVLEAQVVWEELLSSSFVLSVQVLLDLMDAYGRIGCFNEIISVIDRVSCRNADLLPEVYSRAISCFGKQGQLELMENTLKEMVSRGFSVDSATGNAFIIYYSRFGSLTEMETAYGRLKRSRHLIDKEGIRAVSFTYLKERKFFMLGEFLRDVGLGRKDLGNLLWNLLLLSYAGNFKMKSLQREFMRMSEAGFHPDLTTFNIRAVAFSRMSLFWDLHLSLEHMKHESVGPDLVTYGCVVDAYLDKRLGRNLDFALSKMNLDDSPVVSTDPYVFEAFGKGDFHSSSEAFLEFKRQRKWTYRKLIAVYLKKQLRRNQIFWNY